jgi:transcription-repair coupling factor (superfamily II helicase)
LPIEVDNLLAVARFKVVCRKFGITEVSLQGQSVRFSPVLLPESAQVRLQRTYDKAIYKPAVSTMAAARPKGVVKPDGSWAEVKFGGEPLRDQALLSWCADLLEAILGPVLKAVLSN